MHLVRYGNHGAAQFLAIDVTDFGRLEHGGHGEELRVGHPEIGVHRQIGRERIGPVAVEVDGIGHNQFGVGLQIGQDVGDLASGFLRHPTVDGLGGSERVAHKVQLQNFTQVVVLGLVRSTSLPINT